MKAKVRQLLYEHVLQLGAGYFEQRRSGDAVLALVDGVEQLDPFFCQYLPQLVVAGLTPVLIFGFMAFLDLPTALVFLIAALLTLVAPAAFHKLNSSASIGFRRAQASTASRHCRSELPASLPARTTLVASRFRSHSHGARVVSSKSLISKIRRPSGAA